DWHHLGWQSAPPTTVPVRSRLRRPVHHRRSLRRDGGDGAIRLAGRRYLFRGCLPALRADRRNSIRHSRRLPLLAAEDDRADAGRAAWDADLLADVCRAEPGILPHAHLRTARDAATGVHLPARSRMGAAELHLDAG